MKDALDMAAPRALAVFDFDGTMIKGDSIVPFVRQALREGYLPLWQLPGIGLAAWRGMKGRITPEEGKSRALQFLARLPEDTREDFCRRFCREYLMPRIYAQALTRLQEHRAQGDAVVLLSASPDIYLKHMGPLLGAATVLATPTDHQGTVTANNRGQEKVRRLQAWADNQPFAVDWSASWSYGDSAHDLPVMGLCGHPVMVNPKPAMENAAGAMARLDWR